MNSATDPDRKECMRILKEHGAVLVRTKKHKIWKFPDGRIHVMPGSPSTMVTWKNQLRDLRNLLGINEERGAVGERRPKKNKPRKTRKFNVVGDASNVVLRDMSSQLAGLRESLSSGAAEAASELSAPPNSVDFPMTADSPVSILARFWTRLKKVWEQMKGISCAK